jgi:hypothetical protein
MAAVDRNLVAVRDAVEQAKAIAEVFHTGIARFYDTTSATPTTELFHCTVRVKKPRPSAFDAGNETRWATKRRLVLKCPMDIPELADLGGAILSGWVVQIEPVDPANPDGDPTIYGISFSVMSALTSQFAAEREVAVETEVQPTPRAGA